MIRYELSLGDDVVVLDVAVTEVVADDGEDLPQSVSTLRLSGMVDHVLGHKVIEDMVVPRERSPKRSSTTAFGSVTRPWCTMLSVHP